MFAESFHNAADLQSGSQRSRATHSALVAYLEVSICVFEDFDLDTGIAGTLTPQIERYQTSGWGPPVLEGQVDVEFPYT